MNKIALTLAVGALALCGVPAAQAASAQTQAPIVADANPTVQNADMSSHRRRWHRHRHVRIYPRYYRSYGYYRDPYYYRPAPVLRFGFGVGGGPRFHGHRHHRRW